MILQWPSPIFWPFLPTITTDPRVIELHRERTIAHQEFCRNKIKELMDWWMDKMSAELALPYILHSEEFPTKPKQ